MAGTIGTYAQIQSAIYAWLLRASTDLVVTAAQVQNYIFLCEAELNRELEVRELQATGTLTTTADVSYVALPSDFNRIDNLSFTSAPYTIEGKTKQKLIEDHGVTTGRPVAYAVYGSRMYFGKIPDAVYTFSLDYFTDIPALTDSNTTNSILTAYPDLYLYGALRQAQLQIGDATKGQTWGSNYSTIIDRVNLSDIRSKMPRKLRMRPRNPIGT